MSFLMKNKGQGSIEFIIIVSAMFFIFLGMILVIQSRISSARNDKILNTLDEVSNIIITETSLAKSINGYYYREFFLPYSIKGVDYNISLSSDDEVNIRAIGSDYVVFLNYNVSGTIKKGNNSIIVKDGETYMNLCVIDCDINCDQDDGCGGLCPDDDVGTGYFNDCDETDVCGNKRMTLPFNACDLDSDVSCDFEKICDDLNDNDCDGKADLYDSDCSP